MNYKKRKADTAGLIALILFALVFTSCSKENKNEPQSSKTEAPKTENRAKEDVLSNDFTVNYDLEGALKGKMEIMRSGEKLKQNINSEVLGIKSSNVIYIMDNSVYSVLDVGGKKIGTKSDLRGYNESKQTGETITDFKEFEKFLDSKKITGSENVLGYKCDIYETSSGITLSVYNKRYILKIKTPEFMATATALNTNPSYTGAEFNLPSDVEFNKSESKTLKNKSLDSLVNKLKERK